MDYTPMKINQGGLLIVLAIAAGVLILLLIKAQASGTSQQLQAGAAGSSSGTPGVHQPSACCPTEYCPVGPTLHPVPSYCCWCRCYWGGYKGTGGQQMFPCPNLANYGCCFGSPPPPCTWRCPLGPPGLPAG